MALDNFCPNSRGDLAAAGLAATCFGDNIESGDFAGDLAETSSLLDARWATFLGDLGFWGLVGVAVSGFGDNTGDGDGGVDFSAASSCVRSPTSRGDFGI